MPQHSQMSPRPTWACENLFSRMRSQGFQFNLGYRGWTMFATRVRLSTCSRNRSHSIWWTRSGGEVGVVVVMMWCGVVKLEWYGAAWRDVFADFVSTDERDTKKDCNARIKASNAKHMSLLIFVASALVWLCVWKYMCFEFGFVVAIRFQFSWSCRPTYNTISQLRWKVWTPLAGAKSSFSWIGRGVEPRGWASSFMG